LLKWYQKLSVASKELGKNCAELSVGLVEKRDFGNRSD